MIDGGGSALCVTAAERRAFAAWRARLEDLGIEPGPADEYVVAVVAVREVRLRELTRSVARARGEDKLRFVQAERMASADFARGLDQLERTFGHRVEEAAEAGTLEGVLAATGTGRVVRFTRAAPTKARTVVEARILGALGSGAVLTKQELRKRVPGSQGAFLAGVKAAVTRGAVIREGQGTKARPYRYRRVET